MLPLLALRTHHHHHHEGAKYVLVLLAAFLLLLHPTPVHLHHLEPSFTCEPQVTVTSYVIPKATVWYTSESRSDQAPDLLVNAGKQAMSLTHYFPSPIPVPVAAVAPGFVAPFVAAASLYLPPPPPPTLVDPVYPNSLTPTISQDTTDNQMVTGVSIVIGACKCNPCSYAIQEDPCVCAQEFGCGVAPVRRTQGTSTDITKL